MAVVATLTVGVTLSCDLDPTAPGAYQAPTLSTKFRDRWPVKYGPQQQEAVVAIVLDLLWRKCRHFSLRHHST